MYEENIIYCVIYYYVIIMYFNCTIVKVTVHLNCLHFRHDYSVAAAVLM